MGAISICRDNAADSTAISNIFIDEYMKDANDAEIKIYLYLVRMMSSGLPTSTADMADCFNHTEKEVLRSLRYWERRGLLRLQQDSEGNLVGIRLRDPQPSSAVPEMHEVISIQPMLSAERSDVSGCRPAPAAEPSPSPRTPDAPSASVRVSRPEEVSADQLERFQSAESSRQLILIVEQYIGKPLSASEVKYLYYFSEVLHFSPELIDCLVEYCVGLGKRDFRYIGKVAQNWAKEGITTTAQAQAACSRPAGRRRTGRQSAGGFRQFEQNAYDFDRLEQKLQNS